MCLELRLGAFSVCFVAVHVSLVRFLTIGAAFFSILLNYQNVAFFILRVQISPLLHYSFIQYYVYIQKILTKFL